LTAGDELAVQHKASWISGPDTLNAIAQSTDLMLVLALLLLLAAAVREAAAFVRTAPRAAGVSAFRLAANTVTDYPELARCLEREYTSFFSPMERKFYAPNVEFIDPMTRFQGIDKYQNNVDLLAGRTALGRFMFQDASIALHSVEQTGKNQMQTRWTLQVPTTPRTI